MSGRQGMKGADSVLWPMAWLVALLCLVPAVARGADGPPDPFAQLDDVFPAPTPYRTASGAPGQAYWQQHLRYRIAVRLDDTLETIFGDARITYENHSPDTLRYLWFQLDHNRFRPHARSQLSRTDAPTGKLSFARLTEILTVQEAGLGIAIERVEDARGRPLGFHINDTMMRVDLPRPLPPGGQVTLAISWHLRIPPAKEVSNRSAMERFADGAPSYFVAMWYPRPAAYTDYGGWIVKAFLYGEPALEFGDFDVRITVPDSFTVAATGTLQNPADVLSVQERRRLAQARKAKRPVFVVTPDEAKARSGRKPRATKTWHFKAQNVRDFAWAASPRFVWDAKGFRYPSGRVVLAQSFYPPEGMPIWNRFSTEAVIQALDVYARITGLAYPWPHATSVNAPIRSGMEYPMISANAPRPKDPPSYSRREKYALIGVVIHEVGHNWFPMIVSSDERHWLWMDEGLNSFVDDLAMRLWERRPPAARGAPERIAPIMTRRLQRPIMTLSDDYFDRGATGYRKVVAALTVLRDVVLGREVFDRAFREYVRRWAFKRPTPYDFFRTMEDASGVDLDWFWRGWFYTTDHVDVALARVVRARIDTKDPAREAAWRKARDEARGPTLQEKLDAPLARRVERDPYLQDFYNKHDIYTVSPKDQADYEKLLEGLSEKEKALLATGKKLTFVTFENKGGLITPLPLEIRYADGHSEQVTLPAEIWRRNPHTVTKLFVSDQPIVAIRFDPDRGTADVDTWNNAWPRQPDEIAISLTKPKPARNLMKEMGEAPGRAPGAHHH